MGNWKYSNNLCFIWKKKNVFIVCKQHLWPALRKSKNHIVSFSPSLTRLVACLWRSPSRISVPKHWCSLVMLSSHCGMTSSVWCFVSGTWDPPTLWAPTWEPNLSNPNRHRRVRQHSAASQIHLQHQQPHTHLITDEVAPPAGYICFVVFLFRWVYSTGSDGYQCGFRDGGRSSLPGVSVGDLSRDRCPLSVLGHVTRSAGERGLWDCGHLGGDGRSYRYIH